MLLLTRLVDKILEITQYARKRIFCFGRQISTEGGLLHTEVMFVA